MTKSPQPEPASAPDVQPPQFTEPVMPDTAVPDGPADSPDGAPDGDAEAVTLAHHWTDPKTGLNHLPETEVYLDPDTAATLRAAGIAVPGAE